MWVMAGVNSVSSADPGSIDDAVNEHRFAVTYPSSTSPTTRAGVNTAARLGRGLLSSRGLGDAVSPEFIRASDENAAGPLSVRCLGRRPPTITSVFNNIELELGPSPAEGSELECVDVVRSDWLVAWGFDGCVEEDINAGEL